MEFNRLATERALNYHVLYMSENYSYAHIVWNNYQRTGLNETNDFLGYLHAYSMACAYPLEHRERVYAHLDARWDMGHLTNEQIIEWAFELLSKPVFDNMMLDMDELREMDDISEELSNVFGIIKITWSAVDGYHQSKVCNTIEEAREFAHHWAGEHCDVGTTYAVANDGMGTIRVEGCYIRDIYPQ